MFQDIRKFIELQTDIPSVVLITDPLINAECVNGYKELSNDDFNVEQNYYKNSNICLITLTENTYETN